MDTLSTTPPPDYGKIPQVMFSWIDFTLFAVMLGLSALIGIYYGFCSSKQDTANEYLLGGKTMKVFPVAMSLIASHTSGIALLSVPADIYKFGATYWWICVAITINSIISAYVFMPVFMKLQLTSTYEYLSIRFDNKIRTLASFLVVLSTFLYNPIVIYVPALAFAQATGTHLYVITPIVCVICIFYTTIGGLKAVVWTDTLQTMAIAGSMAAVFYLGISSVGGLTHLWEKSVEGHRLDDFLDFSIDLTKRDSVWALVIGSAAHWLCNFAVSQSSIQRFLAVPSITHARQAVLIFCIGIVIVKTVSTITGLIIYAKYADCDLVLTNQISKHDQILPYYVMDVAGHIPGLPGLFIAGVFSAGLSTLSTTLNTLSAIIYCDFLSPFLPADITEKQTSNILKIIVVITGTICTLLVFAVEHMGGVLPLVLTFAGITGGPLLGLFCLGMLFPKANAKGALFGGVGSLLFCSCMVIGNKYYEKMGMLQDFSKPLSTEGCEFYVNTTLPNNTVSVEEKPFVLFRISFWYYTIVGTVVTILVGLVVSWFTNKDDPPVHPDLISPVVRRWMTNEKQRAPPDYFSVERALEMVTYNSKENETIVKER
ncbi:hypothetical protein ILUMI_04251 [Ignelater luminosus]|uniref:Sodium-coupled monocarboxylate transporter 1 n=1 Tax=Ignelater luminosus TaxID=2038154 RepID=A0A8K0DET8_IGNLU|nr:hypothetical protein ILUMI_04251 [Ignelater luminosus]